MIKLNHIQCIDILKALRQMADETVDCVMTSPPYYALRDYGIPDTNFGDWKGQLGLEPFPDLYIKHLCDIFDEIKRVLKRTGTCWVNLGDTYGGSGGAGGEWNKGKRKYERKFRQNNGAAAQKSLCQIPSKFAIEMSNRGWILRNEIIWFKPNCMPSSAKDRFTVDFEKLFFFTKNRRYYFEQQFEPWANSNPHDRKRAGKNIRYNGKWSGNKSNAAVVVGNPERGRNKRCVWRICPQAFPDAHFAVFPEKLVETPIKAGCPEKVCVKCGQPREKIYEGTSCQAFNIRGRDVKEGRIKHSDRRASNDEVRNYQEGTTHVGEGKRFKGYSTCSCNEGFKPGLVLDPFAGSGTSCLVAKKLGRDFIGIDINKEYCRMARNRLRKIPVKYGVG